LQQPFPFRFDRRKFRGRRRPAERAGESSLATHAPPYLPVPESPESSMIEVLVSFSPELAAAIDRMTAAITANTAALQAQTQALTALTSVEQEIEDTLNPTAKSATLHMTDLQGVPMPLTLQLNGPGGSIAPPPAGSPAGVGFQEWDGLNGTGNQVAPIGPIEYSSADPAIVTVDSNGILKQVAVGQAEVTATDTANGMTASDLITVIDVAQSATLNAVPLASAKRIATSASKTPVKK
jgi:hypothetical protein